VGSFAFIWAILDFTRKNRALQQPAAGQIWAAATGGRIDLKFVALGLEAANLANMMAGVFYASLFSHWFYTIWIANQLLWRLTLGESQATARSNPGISRGPVALRSPPG
jgi:hypothetical protein